MYYQVIVDPKEPHEIGFIKKADSSFRFETTFEYVSEWTTIGLDFDRTENPLRDSDPTTRQSFQMTTKRNTKFGEGKK